MSTRSVLLTAAAVIGLTTPALAQADHHEGRAHHHEEVVLHTEGHGTGYEGEWRGDWVDGEHYQGEWEGTYHDDDYPGDAYRHDAHRGVRHLGASPDGRLGYTLADREAWLADCRLLMADGGGYDNDYYYGDRAYYNDRDGNGRVIGGLIGAAAGGVAGNRIADGNRLAGTLIGAGVGGLAGYAIGGAIDDADGNGGYYREASRDEIWAARYCDAYLRRYEMGGGAGGWSQAQPMMMVAMAPHGSRAHRHGSDCRTIVTEEIVEIEEAPAAAPRRARRVVRRPVAEPGKITPID